LNEDVLSASSSHLALRAMQDEEDATATPPRYSEAAGVEHHPQITDFIPRRYRSIALVGLTGAAMVAVLVAINTFVVPNSQRLGMPHTVPFDLGVRGSLADWTAAVVLLVASAICWIIFSIRQHRIDDIRGRYHVWFLASMVCLMMSANSVSSLHLVIASALSQMTGWQALRDGAVWWLAVAGLPIAWIATRAILDASESRLAGAMALFGAGCYAFAFASYLGWIPITDPRAESSITAGARLLGHWSLLVGVIAYARYVILDAQGLIPIRLRRSESRESSAPERTGGSRQTMGVIGPGNTSTAQSSRKSSALRAEWIDGSQPEDDENEDDDRGKGEKLHKSERKQLRRPKPQKRAA
jgi:hypothetical protein